MDPGKFLLFTMGGLADAAYLFIVAAGLSLVFGALRVITLRRALICSRVV